MKLWKKIICLPIALILLLQPALVPAVVAQDLPNAPESAGTFYFQGENTLLFLGKVDGRQYSIKFNKMSLESIPDDARQRLPFLQEAGIAAYRLVAGKGENEAYYKVLKARLDGQVHDDTDDPAILNRVGPFIIVKGVGTDPRPIDLFNFSKEIFIPREFTSKIVLFESWGAEDDVVLKQVKDQTNYWTEFNSVFVYREYAELINTIRAAARRGTRILSPMSTPGLSSDCFELKQSWVVIQDLIREFLIPLPDAANMNKNPNFSNLRDTWWKQAMHGETARNNALSIMEYAGNPQVVLDAIKTDQFAVTEAGASQAASIGAKAERLKTLITNIKNSSEAPLAGGSEEWRCGDMARLTEMKWDPKLTGKVINNYDDLLSAIDTMIERFNFFKDQVDAPIGAGGVCDTAITDSGMTAMIKQAFCALLDVTKGWADSFFGLAVVFLKKSLGVTKNADIDIPVNKDEIYQPPSGTTGGSSATPSPQSAITTTNTIQVPSQLNAPLTSQPFFPAKITLLDDSGGLTSTTMSGTVNVNKTTNPATLTIAAQQTLESNKKYKVFFNAEEKCYRINLTPKGEGLEASDPALEKETACQITTPSATPATPTSPGTENPAQSTPSTGSFSLTKEFAMDYVTYQQLNTGKSTAWVKVGPANYSTSADITGKLTLKSYNSQTSKITISVTLDNPPLSTWANIYVRGGVAKDTELFKFQTRPGEFTSN